MTLSIKYKLINDISEIRSIVITHGKAGER